MPKHDVHTSGTLRAVFADFDPQKIMYYLSDSLKHAFVLFFTLRELRNQNCGKKSYRMSYTRDLYNKFFFL